MRARFQNGWVRTKQRKEGDVWYFEWRDYQAGGAIRSLKVGPVSRYRTESEALRAVELKRLDINRDAAEGVPAELMTVSMLAAHYIKHELESDDDEANASSTRDSYECYIGNHITPKWGASLLSEVKAIAVEAWLKTLTCKPREGKPQRSMAKATKAKVRNVMHILWEHAIRYEFTDRNPISSVRASTKRQATPDILDVPEFQVLFAVLGQRERAMVITDAGSGLRRSELFALQWGDIDVAEKQASVTRSIVHNTRRARVGKCKSEASRAPVPLDDFMLDELQRWREVTAYFRPSDWVFASPHVKGEFPYWPQTIMDRFIRPAAKKSGITKHIGWHTFRRSYATLLKANGEDPKTVQALLRHANFRTTMDIYAQAVTPLKRDAQSRVVRQLTEAIQ